MKNQWPSWEETIAIAVGGFAAIGVFAALAMLFWLLGVR